MKPFQYKAEQLNYMLQTEGWKILDEHLQNKRMQAVEVFLKTRDERKLGIVDGIDALYGEINFIQNQAIIEKKT